MTVHYQVFDDVIVSINSLGHASHDPKRLSIIFSAPSSWPAPHVTRQRRRCPLAPEPADSAIVAWQTRCLRQRGSSLALISLSTTPCSASNQAFSRAHSFLALLRDIKHLVRGSLGPVPPHTEQLRAEVCLQPVPPGSRIHSYCTMERWDHCRATKMKLSSRKCRVTNEETRILLRTILFPRSYSPPLLAA
jgi:hypothetical protein